MKVYINILESYLKVRKQMSWMFWISGYDKLWISKLYHEV